MQQVRTAHAQKTRPDPGSIAFMMQSVAREHQAGTSLDSNDAAWQWLVSMLEGSASKLRSRQLTQIYWSFARLAGVWTPSKALIDVVGRSTSTQLSQFEPMGLSQILWASSKVASGLPTPLIGPLFAAVRRHCASFNAQDCASAIFGLGKLCSSLQSKESRAATDLAAALVGRAVAVGPSMKAVDVANVIHGAGAAGVAFDSSQAQAFGSAVMRNQTYLSHSLTAMIVASLERTYLAESETSPVLAALAERTRSVAADATPQSVVTLLRGWVRQYARGAVAARPVLAVLVREVSAAMSRSFEACDVADVLAATAELLRATSSDDECRAHADALLGDAHERLISDRLDGFDATSLARTLWGMASCEGAGGRPALPEHGRVAAQSRCSALLPSLSPLDIAHITWSHAAGSWPLPPVLLRGLQRRALECGDAFGAESAALLLWSLARLRATPNRELFTSLEGTLTSSAPRLQAQQLSNTLSALVSLEYEDVNSSAMAALMDHARTLAPGMNAKDVADCLWASGALGLHESYPQAIALTVDQLERTAAAMSGPQLASTLWALAKMASPASQLRLIVPSLVEEVAAVGAVNLGMVRACGL